MLEKLIGYQILEISDSVITLKKDDNIIAVSIIDNEGGCCGYNEISTKLYYTPNSNNNPIITSIKLTEDKKNVGDSNIANVVFFGEHKSLAKIDSTSSSGSGWCYGATVSLVCEELGIDKIITSW